MSLKIRRLGHRTELRPSWCVWLVEEQPCRDSRPEEATGRGAGRLGPGVPVALAKAIRHPCARACVHVCVCTAPPPQCEAPPERTQLVSWEICLETPLPPWFNFGSGCWEGENSNRGGE